MGIKLDKKERDLLNSLESVSSFDGARSLSTTMHGV